jgi:hypothetical protein
MRPGMAAAPVPPSPAPVAAPQRTGAVMMPAVTLVTAAPPPPRTASLTAMPMVVPPPAGSTPSRGSPAVAPNAELDVVPGVAEDDDAALAAPGDGEGSAGESEMPVLTPEEMGHAEDAPRPGDGDTHPRISRPSRTERNEDTQPRVTRDADTDPRVQQQRHDDTQPRVVLDEGLLRDVEGADSGAEEKSGPNRPRGSPRRARASSVSIPAQGAVRRTGSTPAVRSAPAPAPSRVDDEEDDDVRVSLTSHEETRRTPFPVRPGSEPDTARHPGENTRRTSVPERPARKGTGLLAVGLVVVLLAGAILTLALSPALRVSMGLEALPEDGPPSPKPVVPARKASASKPSSAVTAEAGAEGAAQAPAEAPVVLAAAPAEAARGEAAVGTETAPAAAKDGAEAVEAPAAAKQAAEAPVAAKQTAEAPGTRPTPAAPTAVAAEDADSDLLAPLPAPTSPPKAAAQVKKAPPPKKPGRPVIIRGGSSRETTQLQREWRDTNALFNRLKNQYSCLQLGLWCTRYASIRNEVEAAGDVNDPDTLAKVRDMKRDLQSRRKDLE